MTHTFEVANVRCVGCVNTIKKVLGEAGFKEISVDLSCEPRKVTADLAGEAQLAQFKYILRNLGYPLANEEFGFGEATVLMAKSFVSCAIGRIS